VIPKSIVVLVLLWLSLVAILQFRPVNDTDLPWQVRTGQLMLEQHHLVTTDQFTFSHFGSVVPTIGWLAQLILALVYGVASWRGLGILNAVLIASAYLMVAWPVIRQRIALVSIVVAVLLGFMVGLTNSSIRPQTFALCSFALVLAWVRSNTRMDLKLLGLIPVLLFWQNTHPSLAVGLVPFSAIAMIAWIQWIRSRSFQKPWAITVVWAMMAVIQIATPDGVSIFQVSAVNADIARGFLGVTEWLPSWDKTVRGAMIVYWVALMISTILFIRLWRKTEGADIGIFVAMTGLSLMAARFALFWGVAMVPIWARWIEQLRPAHLFHWADKGSVRKIHAFAIATCGLVLTFSVPLLSGQPVFSRNVPVHAVDESRRLLPKGCRIYNYPESAGVLVLLGDHTWTVAIDGRLYIYDRDEWREYVKEATGRVPLGILMEKRRPSAFFLHPVFHRGLISLLRGSPQWRETYSDSNTTVFLPRQS
jgi:hypothetical protein